MKPDTGHIGTTAGRTRVSLAYKIRILQGKQSLHYKEYNLRYDAV
jgi:hypothetical protein